MHLQAQHFSLVLQLGPGIRGQALGSRGKGALLPPEGVTGPLFGAGGWGGAAGRSLKGAGPARRAPPSREGQRLKLAGSKDPRASRARLLPAPSWKSHINQTPYLT